MNAATLGNVETQCGCHFWHNAIASPVYRVYSVGYPSEVANGKGAKPMAKIEKQMIGAIIVTLALVAILAAGLAKALKPVQEQIDQGGLKSVFSEIWNGKGK